MSVYKCVCVRVTSCMHEREEGGRNKSWSECVSANCPPTSSSQTFVFSDLTTQSLINSPLMASCTRTQTDVVPLLRRDCNVLLMSVVVVVMI